MDVGEALMEWAAKEMDCAVTLKPESLRRMCAGPTGKHWKWIVEHVRSESRVRHVRNNLKLYDHHGSRRRNDDEASTSERDLTTKELKETEHRISKCEEKCGKLDHEVRDHVSDCRKIQGENEAKKEEIGAHAATLDYLKLLLSDYEGRVLPDLAKNVDEVDSALERMSEQRPQPSDAKTFEKLCTEAEDVLSRLLSDPEAETVRFDPGALADGLQAVGACNEMLARRFRDVAGDAAKMEEKEEPLVPSRTEELLDGWRAAHVEEVSEARAAREEADSFEATVEAEKAKNPEATNAASLRWMAMRERKARTAAALCDLRRSLAVGAGNDDAVLLSSKREELESLRRSVRERRAQVGLVAAKCADFGTRISFLGGAVRSLAEEEVAALASEAAGGLSRRKDAVADRRMNSFRLMPRIASLNVPSGPGRSDSRLVAARPGRNLSLELLDLSLQKARLFDEKEFLARSASGAGSIDLLAELRSLLAKAKSDCAGDVPALLDEVVRNVDALRRQQTKM